MKRLWLSRTLLSVATACIFTLTVADASSQDTDFMGSDPAKADYNQVGMPIQESAQSLTLSNQELGMQGPVTVSGTYSSAFGYELEATYTRLLNANNAISLLGAYAGDENRMDVTFAHAWDAHQRTKVSIERLAEQLDFDYDTGDTSEWIAQYAFGAGYQYVFDKGLINDVEFSGYYAQAESKDLDTIRYTGTDGLLYDNYRHIAGATSQGVELSTDILPWATGLFGVGLNYDKITYDTQYEDTDAENDSGLGFTLSLQQILSKHSKLAISGSQREVYDSYSTTLSVLTGSDIELGLTAETTVGRDSSPNDNRLSLAIAYYIDDHSRYASGYHLGSEADRSDLASWASQSLAYMNMVLAAADEKSVKVTTASVDNPGDAADQSSTSPTVTLYTGTVNTVDISTYIDTLSLSHDQATKDPRITGGPDGVTFVYDAENKSLVTEQIVPEEDAGKEAKPILVVFPQEARLTFNAKVMSSDVPYQNPGFIADYTVAINTSLNLPVFELENPNNPAESPQASNVFYINPSVNNQVMTLDYKNAQVISDANHCGYAFAIDGNQVSVTTGVVSNVCPGPATLNVKGTNGRYYGPAVTITISATTGPSANGSTIAPAEINHAYAYTFTSNQVSPGQDSTYDATNTKIEKVLVNKVDVTETSSLYLDVQPSSITIKSDAVPSTFSGETFDVYLHVVNNKEQAVDNTAPFTIDVESPPVVPSSISMTDATVDVDYHYSFFTLGGVTSGSSNIDTNHSSAVMKLVVDGKESAVPTDLGLSTVISATDVITSGLFDPKYAGDAVHVYLNLCNTDKLCADNNTAPATMNLVANSAQSPYVGSGSIPVEGSTSVVYPGYNFENTKTGAGVTAGTGREYVGLNTHSTNGTYAKVAKPDGTDITNLVNVQLANNGTPNSVLSLVSNGAVIDPSLQTGDYNVYVHVYNDAKIAASNCSDLDCSALTSGQPFVMHITNTHPVIDGDAMAVVAATGSAYSYTFSSTEVSPGENQTAYNNLNTESTNGTYIVSMTNTVTKQVYTRADLNMELAANNASLVLKTVGTGVIPNTIPAGTYDVVLHVTNMSNESATNTNDPFILTIANSTETPYVGTGALPSTETSVTYVGNTFPNSSSGDGITAGAFHDFEHLNAVGASGTYVKVLSNTNTDVTSNLGVELTTTGSSGTEQLVLTAKSGQSVSDVLTSGDYHVFIHTWNGVAEASNCGTNCSVVTYASGAPYTLAVTNTKPTNMGGSVGAVATTGSAYTPYGFSTTEINPGVNQSAYSASFNNASVSTGTYIKSITNASTGQTYTGTDFNLMLTASGTQLIMQALNGNAIPGSIPAGQYNIVLHVSNSKGESTENTTNYTLQVNADVVTAYLNCPPASVNGKLNPGIVNGSNPIYSPVTTAAYTGDITEGNTVGKQSFIPSVLGTSSAGAFLYRASIISGGTQLLCEYGLSGSTITYKASTTLPTGATKYNAGDWNGSGVCFGSSGQSEANNNSCKIMIPSYKPSSY